MQFALATNRFPLSKGFFDERPFHLTARVACVARRPLVNRTGRRPRANILRHLRDHTAGAGTRHERDTFIALVGAQRAPLLLGEDASCLPCAQGLRR